MRHKFAGAAPAIVGGLLMAYSGFSHAQQGDGTRVAIAAAIVKPDKVEATRVPSPCCACAKLAAAISVPQRMMGAAPASLCRMFRLEWWKLRSSVRRCCRGFCTLCHCRAR